MTPMPMIQTPSSLFMQACGLDYLWEDGFLNVFAEETLVLRQECSLFTAKVRLQAIRDANFNFLQGVAK
jgi:hypothetical protein